MARFTLVALALAGIVHTGSALTLGARSETETLHRRWTPTGSSDNSNKCTPLELIWFRSAAESQARLGLLGDPMYSEILKYEPKASAYNVIFNEATYEETVTNFLGGQDATQWINKRAAQCPNQRYVVGAYSKGTLGVHQMFPAADVRPRVAATVVIGDAMRIRPYFPPAALNSTWPSNGERTLSQPCNFNDLICWPGGTDHDTHLYGGYIGQIPALAKFMIDRYQENKRAVFPNAKGIMTNLNQVLSSKDVPGLLKNVVNVLNV
ncbi:Cutinase [Ceraceosorus bombacis]|uniref:Cutinase n=1 Tax=Ceraceosorus bombacis TaxID=401625 RepID=A0A0P1BK80_9BASI|nr:Cutinase [Ceraceosorus bombacis]